MAAALRRHGIAFEEVDVDADPGLDERYGEDVPVLLRSGVELCRHRLTPEALAKERPGIIYLSISCYGHGGPFSSRVTRPCSSAKSLANRSDTW